MAIVVGVGMVASAARSNLAHPGSDGLDLAHHGGSLGEDHLEVRPQGARQVQEDHLHGRIEEEIGKVSVQAVDHRRQLIEDRR